MIVVCDECAKAIDHDDWSHLAGDPEAEGFADSFLETFAPERVPYDDADITTYQSRLVEGAGFRCPCCGANALGGAVFGVVA